MPRVIFTSHLQRHLEAPDQQTEGRTVREVLEGAFATQPRLRPYILDDQGRLRRHIVVFVDGVRIADPVGLTDPVAPNSEVYVLQALSGGRFPASPPASAPAPSPSLPEPRP